MDEARDLINKFIELCGSLLKVTNDVVISLGIHLHSLREGVLCCVHKPTRNFARDYLILSTCKDEQVSPEVSKNLPGVALLPAALLPDNASELRPKGNSVGIRVVDGGNAEHKNLRFYSLA
jgi:hypothetical protein